MYTSIIISNLLFLISTGLSAWSGIAVVGNVGHDGQVFSPDTGGITKADNFGFNKSFYEPASTSCNCKFYTSGGQQHDVYLGTINEANPRKDQHGVLHHMHVPRAYHSMTCMDNDTLIMCGGMNAGRTLNSCELCHIFNPLCIRLTPMPAPVQDHAAIASQNRLYIIGGGNQTDGSSGNQLWEYSPTGQSWSRRASMNTKRLVQPGAVLLNTGRILVCGGSVKTDASGALNTCESYDPLLDKWTAKASMNSARTNFALVRLNGKIYAVGGYKQGGLGDNSVESYDEKNDQWRLESKSLLPDNRYSAAGAIDQTCVT